LSFINCFEKALS